MIAYAITDPTTLHFQTLSKDIKRFVQKASMIVYRDKQTPNYAKHAQDFLKVARGFEKVLLHGDSVLAHALGADGVHLMSSQYTQIPQAKALGLFVIASTHTLEEIQLAEGLGADMVTLSPLFTSPGKGAPIGPKRFATIVAQVSLPVIALGGILDEGQIKQAKVAGAAGFASIRYFA